MINVKIRFSRWSDDQKYCVFLVGIFVAKVVGEFWKGCMGDGFVLQLLSKIVQALLLLVALDSMFKRPLSLILTEAALIFLHIFSFVQGYATGSILINSLFYACILYVPMAISAFRIEDKKVLIDCFYRISWVCSILLIVMAIKRFAFDKDSGYDMALGYYLLIPTLFLIDRFTKEGGFQDIIMAIIDCFAILFWGSRGPFLCIIGYGMLLFLFSDVMSVKRKVFYIVMLGVAVLLVLQTWTQLLNGLNYVLDYFNISSRSVFLLQKGTAISHTSGRDAIRALAFRLLSESPFLGCGIRALEGVYGVGTYPHNIVVDTFLSFGYPIGIFMCVLFLVIVFRGLMSKRSENKRILLIFLAYCLSLSVSGTFINSWQFFVLLGLSLSGSSRLKFNIC